MPGCHDIENLGHLERDRNTRVGIDLIFIDRPEADFNSHTVNGLAPLGTLSIELDRYRLRLDKQPGAEPVCVAAASKALSSPVSGT